MPNDKDPFADYEKRMNEAFDRLSPEMKQQVERLATTMCQLVTQQAQNMCLQAQNMATTMQMKINRQVIEHDEGDNWKLQS
jgi:hypothetical protein